MAGATGAGLRPLVVGDKHANRRHRAGNVWQLQITQAWAVGALALMALPILMIYLSVALPARANRITNIVVASRYLVVSVWNVAGESWAYYFALVLGLEVLVLALILRHAWAWPRVTPSDDGHPGDPSAAFEAPTQSPGAVT